MIPSVSNPSPPQAKNTNTPSTTNAAEIPSAANIAGLVALGLCIAASVMLVAQHFTSMLLPGCGAGSACAELTSGRWGRVPVVGLPVSFAGLAYFLAAVIAWIGARRDGVSPRFRWLIRLGALTSIFYVVVMVVEASFCVYCTAAHIGNLAFWLVAERASPSRGVSWRQPVTVVAVFVVATGLLAGTDSIWTKRVGEAAEAERQSSTSEIINRPPSAPGAAFTGRYLQGPEKAQVRIVIYSDYQCPDCRRIEAQARQILAERDDVSFSAKHFPMSNLCNKYTRSNRHPNACWAARAAETAGMLRGSDGFFEMHRLLFDRGGSFTDAELDDFLTDLAYDVTEFKLLMQSAKVDSLIRQDIDEARALGLHYTPMVFVNGVEMKGFTAENALINTVHDVIATNPEPRGAEFDQPPMAAVKYVDDWRDQPARFADELDGAWSRGPDDATVHVLVCSDLSSRFTPVVDAEIRALMEKRDDVRYSFLHYPVNQACNPKVSKTTNPMACLASQAAEAAGILDGDEGYWRMYDWIVANAGGLSEESIATAATDLGLDPEALLSAMASPEVQTAIRDDATTASRIGVRRAIPAVYVNSKSVPRWRLKGADILGAIADEAANQR